MEDLQKFLNKVEALENEFHVIRNHLDTTYKTAPNWAEYKKNTDDLRKKVEEAIKQTVHPVSGILHEVIYHSQQIEGALGKIERGINEVDEITYHVEKLKELFSNFEDAKDKLKKLERDLDDMEEDIKEEKDLQTTVPKVGNYNEV